MVMGLGNFLREQDKDEENLAGMGTI